MKTYKVKPYEVEAFQMTKEIYERLIAMGKNEDENPVTVNLDELPGIKLEWNWHTQKLSLYCEPGEVYVNIGDYIVNTGNFLHVRLKDSFLGDFEEVKEEIVKSNLELISKIVCEYHCKQFSNVIKKTRQRDFLEVRQIGMNFSREYSPESFRTIGEYWGGYDSATAMHACKIVRNLCETNGKFRKDYEELNEKIREALKM